MYCHMSSATKHKNISYNALYMSVLCELRMFYNGIWIIDPLYWIVQSSVFIASSFFIQKLIKGKMYVFCDFVAWFISCTYDSRVIHDILSQEVLSGCFITVYDIKHSDQFNGQLISELTVNYVITVIICLVLNFVLWRAMFHGCWQEYKNSLLRNMFLKSCIWKLAMYSHCWTINGAWI